MDISKKYIEMCSKAQEIQIKVFESFVSSDFIAVSLSKNNKYFYDEFLKKLIINDFGSICNNHFYGCGSKNATGIQFKDLFDEIIWLPRQDQLQEIKKGIYSNWDGMRKFVMKTKEVYYMEFESFEQLWLAYLMDKDYNKIWSEEKQDWLAID